MMADNINIKIHIVNRDPLANILIWSMCVKLKLLVKRKEILLLTHMHGIEVQGFGYRIDHVNT